MILVASYASSTQAAWCDFCGQALQQALVLLLKLFPDLDQDVALTGWLNGVCATAAA